MSASYLYGAPVSGAHVSWSVSWRPREIRAPGSERFSFRAHDVDGYLRYLTGDSLELDSGGEGRIVVPRSALPRAAEE